MRIRTVVAVVFLAPAMAGAAIAQPITPVRPALETPNLPDNRFEADADDPAIWIHPRAPARSLVVTAVKDGGLRVHDLRGRLVQTVDPVMAAAGTGRINNVDVAYGLRLAPGRAIDVAVASDRGLDVIRVYRIDGDARRPLTEITAAPAARAFPARPRADGNGLEPNPLADQNTVYGLALWRDQGRVLAAVTQRGKARLRAFQLEGRRDGKVAVKPGRDFRFPLRHDGQDLRVEDEDDPLRDWSPQFEGLAVDQRTGTLYAGQEDVGIWRVDLRAGTRDAAPFYETRGSRVGSFKEPASRVARDVEGLCIYHGPGRSGYLLASSQGNAHGEAPTPDPPLDDSFAVFELRARAAPRYRGSFRVAAAAGIDAVQESDGAEVSSTGLPGFPSGLFVTQDGYDGDEFSGETHSTNFKYVPWERIANAFNPPLLVTPRAWNPRTP